MSKNRKSKLKPLALTGRDLVAMTCFFVSGFVGLVYEICWIRKASLAFGSTTLAVSTVVAVFFGGLALGSYIFGRYSQKTLRPLKLYALLEISLGVIVLLNPALFSWAENLYGLFYPSIMHSFAFLSFIRFILMVSLILLPTILMGATLPLFCRQYVVNESRISLSVGLLYGLNTLGAAIGCIVCGFYLIPHIGLNKTIWLGGVLNILIGLTIRRMQITATSSHRTDAESKIRRGKNVSSSMPPPSIYVHSTARDVFTVSALFFFSGFAALGSEILWIRYLSLIIHNTVYTYTLTLTITLTGIVLGSILISSFADRTYRRALIFGAVHVLTGISVLIVLMLPAEWWKGVIDTQDFSTHLWIFMLVLLFPAILSGISFPLAIRMVVGQPLLAGIGVGKMTAINTVGGIAGSLVIGFIVLPWLGLQKSLLLTTGVSLFIGFAAWLLLERTLRPLVRNVIVALSLLVWVAIPFLTGTRLPADFLAERDKLVDFREGLNSNLAVVKEDNVLILEIDRMWQGQDRKSYQIMAAHIPMLLHHDPKDVLVIGVGVGQTASRFLLYDVTQLHCVDIEGELFGFVQKHYESGWMDDKRLRFIIEDGRNYLTHTDHKYDIISIEVGQVFRPGLASFYTADFYRHARNRLNNNGIVCQFVPISFFGPDEFRSVIRSFLKVFPESILWYNTSEFLLIGSIDNRLKLSSERLKMLSSDDVIQKDLCFAYWGGPAHWLNRREVFLANFLCGPESLAKLTAQASVYRDDLPLLEYITAKNQIRSPKPTIELIRPYIDPPNLVLSERPNDKTLSAIQSIREQNLRDIVANFLYRSYLNQDNVLLLQKAIQWNPYNVDINIQLGTTLSKQGKLYGAITHFTKALQIEPNSHEAHVNLGVTFLRQGRLEEAITHLTEALQIESNRYEPHVNLGMALLRQGKLEEAITHFIEALRIEPDSAEAYYNLGITLSAQGKLDEAIRHYHKALRVKPNFAETYYNLGITLSAQGKLDEAIRHYRKALRVKPNFAEAHNNLGYALGLQGKFDEAIRHYRQALRIKPDSAEAHCNLGNTLSAQGKLDEAIRHYRQALWAKPDYTEAYYKLGKALQSQGRLDEAIIHWIEMVKLKPDSAPAHYNLGLGLSAQGRLDEASMHFIEALRFKPDWVDPMKNLAWLLATHKEAKFHNPEEAIRLAERACELTSYKQPGVLDTLAAAYAAAGNFPEAVKTAKKAVALALASGRKEEAAEIQRRLELYKAGRPYREPSLPQDNVTL